MSLFLLPLAVFSGTLSGLAVAEQRWGIYMLVRILNTIGAAIVIVVPSLAHALTRSRAHRIVGGRHLHRVRDCGKCPVSRKS